MAAAILFSLLYKVHGTNHCSYRMRNPTMRRNGNEVVDFSLGAKPHGPTRQSRQGHSHAPPDFAGIRSKSSLSLVWNALVLVGVLLTFVPVMVVEAHVYLANEGTKTVGGPTAFPAIALPPWEWAMPEDHDGVFYSARLVVLDNDLPLCHWTHDLSSISTSVPLALLAASHEECSTLEKIQTALTIPTYASNRYLILYGDHEFSAQELPKDLPPLPIQLVRVSRQSGHALIQYSHEVPDNPLIYLDSETVPTVYDSYHELGGDGDGSLLLDWQDDEEFAGELDPSVDLFFLVVLSSSIFFLCAAAAQQEHTRRRSLQRRRQRQSQRQRRQQQQEGDDTESNNGTRPTREDPDYMGRNLLSREEIERYILTSSNNHLENTRCATQQTEPLPVDPAMDSTSQQQSTTVSMDENHNENDDDDDDHHDEQLGMEDIGNHKDDQEELVSSDALVPAHCAICLEDFEEGTSQERPRIVLPCQHVYHADCILPWLTERSGTCPLCKFDVYQHVQEALALDFSLPAQWTMALERIQRRLWNLVPGVSSSSSTRTSHDYDTVETSPSQPPVELELAESLSRSTRTSSFVSSDSETLLRSSSV